MANGDITKEFENDKIEVVQTWNIQVRKAIKIMEELSPSSMKNGWLRMERKLLIIEKNSWNLNSKEPNINNAETNIQT